MDWKELGEAVAKIGLPLLGSVLPIPGGTAIGTALASRIGAKSGEPADILTALTGSAEAMQKAKEFEGTHEETMLKLTLDHEDKQRSQDSTDIATVNATMQAELVNSANESWYQKAWRPANGFAVAAASFLAVVFVCALFYQALTSSMGGNSIAQVVNIIPSLATSIAMILGVPGTAVGIAAWHRGVQKRIAADQVNSSGAGVR